MSVSPELCKLLCKTGSSKSMLQSTCLPAQTHTHTHIPRNSYRSAWAGHMGIWTLLAHSCTCLRAQQGSEFSQEIFQLDQKVSFCPVMAVRRHRWSSFNMGVPTCSHHPGERFLSAKKMPGPAWAFGFKNNRNLQAMWPDRPALLPKRPKAPHICLGVHWRDHWLMILW